jgi:hypothetical protein
MSESQFKNWKKLDTVFVTMARGSRTRIRLWHILKNHEAAISSKLFDDSSEPPQGYLLHSTNQPQKAIVFFGEVIDEGFYTILGDRNLHSHRLTHHGGSKTQSNCSSATK